MTHEELKAIIAAKMDDPNTTAADITSTILSALAEPTEGMLEASDGLPEAYGHGFVWRAMLKASPLGEQSE